MTAVFARLDSRGTDAAGFWGTTAGGEGTVHYHKEPIKSSDFVKRSTWEKLGDANLNLLICHARGASIGSGFSHENKNNHPFVSFDRNIALIHNGKVPDSEYTPLSKKYEVVSKCDSEILLRIFEQGERCNETLEEFDKDAPTEISTRLRGLRNIWSQVIKGHMALAVAENLDNSHRRLWLTRNKHRPLWVIDMRKTLGQVFFCSTPEIWYDAIRSVNIAKPYVLNKTKLVELPEQEIWMMEISDNKPIITSDNFRKFDLSLVSQTSSLFQGKPLEVVKKNVTSKVVTRLDYTDKVHTNLFNFTENKAVEAVVSTNLTQTSSANSQTNGSTTTTSTTNSNTNNKSSIDSKRGELTSKVHDKETIKGALEFMPSNVVFGKGFEPDIDRVVDGVAYTHSTEQSSSNDGKSNVSRGVQLSGSSDDSEDQKKKNEEDGELSDPHGYSPSLQTHGPVTNGSNNKLDSDFESSSDDDVDNFEDSGIDPTRISNERFEELITKHDGINIEDEDEDEDEYEFDEENVIGEDLAMTMDVIDAGTENLKKLVDDLRKVVEKKLLDGRLTEGTLMEVSNFIQNTITDIEGTIVIAKS